MFTWRPIYHEIAEKLKEFQFNNVELVELLVEMKRSGLLTVSTTDKDDSGAEFQLEEMDPFTFIANYNRNIKDENRQSIIQYLKEKWSLEADVPSDFHGIPIVRSQNARYFPYKNDRHSDHVPKLWNIFVSSLKSESADSLDVKIFDECLKLKGVGEANLTMGMFWVNPEIWMALDKKNLENAKALGIDTKPKNGQEYLAWLNNVTSRIDVSICDFSHEAHVFATTPDDPIKTTKPAELAEPFSRLFDDIEHAKEVSGRFISILECFDSDDLGKRLVVSYRNLGNSGGQARIIYGKWVLFGYRRRTNDTSFQILLPQSHAAVSNLEVSYHFTNQKTGEKFVLGWVDERWFNDHLEEFWDDLFEGVETALSLFSTWSASPYAKSHVQEFYHAITYEPDWPGLFTKAIKTKPESDVSFWLLTPGENAKYWDDCYNNNIGTIGWDELGDLNQYESEAAIAKVMPELRPDKDPKVVAKMLWYFFHDMKQGDVVFAKNGRSKVNGWGVVTGDYRYDETRTYHQKTIPIHWYSDTIVELSEEMKRLSMNTLTPMDTKDEFLEFMYENYEGLREYVDEGTSPKPKPSVYKKEHALADLFMSEQQLDRIVKQLKRKKNIVLQGAPGTGKTFVARRIAYLLMGEKDPERAPMVQFHQSTAYEDFIQGYRPDGDGGFVLKNGGFYEFCQRARRHTDRPFVYIIDEINRGNLSKVFGELLMLLEHDKRNGDFAVPLTYAKSISETFYIPANVHLIGTMNTADRSLSLVDYALRRRFAFIDLAPGFESDSFAEFLKTNGATDELVGEIRRRMGRLNEMIGDDKAGLGRGYRIGHSYFVPSPGHAADGDWMDEVMECEVIPLLEEYWCDDEKQLEEACRVARGQS